jgi:hypothetical protein
MKIHSRIQKLLLEEQVDSSKIAVLIVDAINKRGYLQAIEKLPLPKGYILNLVVRFTVTTHPCIGN